MVHVVYTDFRIKNEMAGWQEIADSGYAEFAPDSLHSLIHGAATPYIDMGLLRGLRQKMAGAEKKTLEMLVMEYHSADECAIVFEYKKKNITQIPIGSYPLSAAFAREIIYGIMGYAFFNEFYFDFMFYGFDTTAHACREASLFLDFYVTRMQE